MDWLRRNWPDLAIGIALVAVIAGIVATLLTGGSFFPLGPTQPATTPATPPAVTAPAPAPEVSPDPAAEAPEIAPDPAAAEDAPNGVAEAPDVVDEPVSADPPPAPAPVQPGVTVLAPDGTPADEPAPAPTPPIATTPPVAPEPAPEPAPSVAAPAPAAPTPAPAPPSPATPSPAAPMPVAAADPEAPFRVSVGAFADPDNAARQAETFRAAGYPVFTGTQGNLTIVLVGPYPTEADAAAVAARIRAGGFGIDPVIYRFEPDAAAAPVSPAPAAPTPAPPAPSTPSIEPAPAPTAAPSPPVPTATRYLQVGAFTSPESAQPLRDRLASLGFATSEVREDGMLKLLVGPFDAAGLGEARQRLAAQGIESFAR